jgi:hypothetical protein
MKYHRNYPYKLPPLYLTDEETVEDILDDLIAQPRPAWVDTDAATLAQALELGVRQGIIAPVTEAMWRYYELVNVEGQ